MRFRVDRYRTSGGFLGSRLVKAEAVGLVHLIHIDCKPTFISFPSLLAIYILLLSSFESALFAEVPSPVKYSLSFGIIGRSIPNLGVMGILMSD